MQWQPGRQPQSMGLSRANIYLVVVLAAFAFTSGVPWIAKSEELRQLKISELPSLSDVHHMRGHAGNAPVTFFSSLLTPRKSRIYIQHARRKFPMLLNVTRQILRTPQEHKTEAPRQCPDRAFSYFGDVRSNCRRYLICIQHPNSPTTAVFDRFDFVCPPRMSFDAFSQTCSTSVITGKRCERNKTMSPLSFSTPRVMSVQLDGDILRNSMACVNKTSGTHGPLPNEPCGIFHICTIFYGPRVDVHLLHFTAICPTGLCFNSSTKSCRRFSIT